MTAPIARFILPPPTDGAYRGGPGSPFFPYTLEVRKAEGGGIEITAYHDPNVPEDDWLREFTGALTQRWQG